LCRRPSKYEPVGSSAEVMTGAQNTTSSKQTRSHQADRLSAITVREQSGCGERRIMKTKREAE
ncbi:MAG: hypothetical protein KDA70_01390, partial [Planctomycetaceae bacterium]|nr:hypothetical protein [Planctomycetaceae bacterium]